MELNLSEIVQNKSFMRLISERALEILKQRTQTQNLNASDLLDLINQYGKEQESINMIDLKPILRIMSKAKNENIQSNDLQKLFTQILQKMENDYINKINT